MLTKAKYFVAAVIFRICAPGTHEGRGRKMICFQVSAEMMADIIRSKRCTIIPVENEQHPLM